MPCGLPRLQQPHVAVLERHRHGEAEPDQHADVDAQGGDGDQQFPERLQRLRHHSAHRRKQPPEEHHHDAAAEDQHDPQHDQDGEPELVLADAHIGEAIVVGVQEGAVGGGEHQGEDEQQGHEPQQHHEARPGEHLPGGNRVVAGGLAQGPQGRKLVAGEHQQGSAPDQLVDQEDRRPDSDGLGVPRDEAEARKRGVRCRKPRHGRALSPLSSGCDRNRPARRPPEAWPPRRTSRRR